MPDTQAIKDATTAWDRLTGILKEIASSILRTQSDVAGVEHSIKSLKVAGIRFLFFVLIIQIAAICITGSFIMSHAQEARRNRIANEARWNAFEGMINELKATNRHLNQACVENLGKMRGDMLRMKEKNGRTMYEKFGP